MGFRGHAPLPRGGARTRSGVYSPRIGRHAAFLSPSETPPSPPRPVGYGHARYHARMGTNKAGEHGAAAIDAISERLAEKVAPKLERLRDARIGARELREEVSDLNEAVEELAEDVAEVKQAVRAARKRQTLSAREAED